MPVLALYSCGYRDTLTPSRLAESASYEAAQCQPRSTVRWRSAVGPIDEDQIDE